MAHLHGRLVVDVCHFKAIGVHAINLVKHGQHVTRFAHPAARVEKTIGQRARLVTQVGFRKQLALLLGYGETRALCRDQHFHARALALNVAKPVNDIAPLHRDERVVRVRQHDHRVHTRFFCQRTNVWLNPQQTERSKDTQYARNENFKSCAQRK